MKTKTKENHTARAQGAGTNKEQFYKVTLVWTREREGTLTVWADSPSDAMQKASFLSWAPVPLVNWSQSDESMRAKEAQPITEEKGAAHE